MPEATVVFPVPLSPQTAINVRGPAAFWTPSVLKRRLLGADPRNVPELIASGATAATPLLAPTWTDPYLSNSVAAHVPRHPNAGVASKFPISHTSGQPLPTGVPPDGQGAYILPIASEHAGGEDVGGLDRDEVAPRETAAGDEAVRLPEAGPIEGVLHAPAVGEVRPLDD